MAEAPPSSDRTLDQADATTTSNPPAEEKQQVQNGEEQVRERPVREQLRNTSITPSDALTSAMYGPAASDDVSSEEGSVNNTAHQQAQTKPDTSVPSLRGRRKRSFDEFNPEDADDSPDLVNSKHFRKRSRDNRNIGTDEEEEEEEEEDDNDDDDDDNEQSSDDSGLHPPASDSNSKQNPDSLPPQQTADPTPSSGADRPTTPPASSKLEDATSPQNKRNRDQFMIDNDSTAPTTKSKGSVAPTSDISTSDAPKSTETASTIPPIKAIGDEPESKRLRDESLYSSKGGESSTSPKIPSLGGFANTSTESPFGALTGNKSPPLSSQPQTSSSAFASSGFASFAATSTSPFGAVAPASGTGEKDEKEASVESKKDTVPASSFAALSSAPSPFASAGGSTFGSQSVFGKMSNGFGSFGGADRGFGAPISSFASQGGGSGIIGLSSKPSKPFGSTPDPDDEENGDNDEEGGEGLDAVITSKGDAHKDSRFFEQEVETGEEDEETLFTSRAKLYVSQDKQWKERGVGIFKVNASSLEDQGSNGDASTKRTARFIMRADGSHRVVLNTPIKKEIKLEDPAGGPPKGKTAIFLGFIDEKPMMMQLKMRSNVQTEELHDVVISLQKEL